MTRYWWPDQTRLDAMRELLNQPDEDAMPTRGHTPFVLPQGKRKPLQEQANKILRYARRGKEA